jgi:hypothetical protein
MEEKNRQLKKDLEETQQVLAQLSEELCVKETREKETQTTKETELVREVEEKFGVDYLEILKTLLEAKEEETQRQAQTEVQPK